MGGKLFRESVLPASVASCCYKSKEYKTSTSTIQRICNKHLVGSVRVDTFLIFTEFCPLVTEYFAHRSVVEVRMLTTNDAAMFLTEYQKRIHWSTNIDATFS